MGMRTPRMFAEPTVALSAHAVCLFRKPGSFCGLQLLSGDQLEQSVSDIQALLARSLVEDAPLQDELGWLNNLPDRVGTAYVSCP